MSEDKKEIAKNLANVDGFDGAEDIGVEGEEEGQQSNSRVIQGGRLGFTNDYTWVLGENEPFNTAHDLVAVDTARVMQKWVAKKPAGHIFIPADQKWPNLDDLNNACPKTEWGEDFNNRPQGPWQRQRVVYFVDLNTMEKFTWASGTVGADICIREFREKVHLARRYRGNKVFPVIRLADVYMHTRFGGRQRPDLKIIRWIAFGPGGTALPAPNPEAGRLADGQSAAKSAATAELSAGVREVAPVTLAEQMGNDSVPW